MPRKTKITAIPVDAPEEGLANTVEGSSGIEEPKTDAEQMTDVMNEAMAAADVVDATGRRKCRKQEPSELLQRALVFANLRWSSP